ncbi:MAG: hypothetical protein MUC46_09905 [Desulfobacterales bacterium]|jgi:hypothetical protein|nr:hypothetical protein [Desulfobacterales bacterium]
MKTRIWICVMLAVALAACAHTGSKPPTSFNATLPEGWRTVDTDEPMLFMTKDGGYKQFIMIRERPLADPFVFTQRSMYAGMLPEQAAELVVNEIIADTNISNFSLLENLPTRITGHSGFRLTFLYTDGFGFIFKTIYYGFITGNKFYSIRYGATEDPTKENYFQRDLKTFQQVFESFKLAAPKAS